jgi:type I restriction enzyme S subunit
MSSELPEHTLKSLCLLVADCPHATPKWTDSGIFVLRNQNIKNGRLDLSNPSYTDEAHYLGRIRRAEPKKGDIVITREAPMGDVCLIPENLVCCLGQRQVLLRPDPQKIDSRFMLYVLQSPYLQHQISWSEGTGSTVSNLRIPVLEALCIPTPRLKQQREIAELLGALDDRITLLRETNTLLEQIAQKIFKSWFVDFDPVRAKQEGRQPEGIDEETAALFPDSFEESELGLVPRGWRAGTLGDLCTFQNGYAFKSKDWTDNGHPVVKIGEVKPGIINLSGCSFVSPATVTGLDRFRLKRGDLLVGMTGYVGETGLVPSVEPAAYLNQRVGRIEMKSTGNRFYVYCLVRSQAFK